MDQPKFKFGEVVEVMGRKFIINEVVYLENRSDLEEGFYYGAEGMVVRFPEVALKQIKVEQNDRIN